MTYEYECTECNNRFDVIKSYKEIDKAEVCTKCSSPADRKFVPTRVHFSGTSVQHAEFNPAFGQVVKSKYHREELAKRRGWVEVGNDYKTPATLHKETDQAIQEKRNKRWESEE